MTTATTKPVSKKERTESTPGQRPWYFDILISNTEKNVSVDEREAAFLMFVTTSNAFKAGDQAIGVELHASGPKLGEFTSVELTTYDAWQEIGANPDLVGNVKRFSVTADEVNAMKEDEKSEFLEDKKEFFSYLNEELLLMAEGEGSPDQSKTVKSEPTVHHLQLGSMEKDTVRIIAGKIRTGHFHQAFVTDDIALPVNQSKPETASNYGLNLEVKYAEIRTTAEIKDGSEPQELGIVVQED